MKGNLRSSKVNMAPAGQAYNDLGCVFIVGIMIPDTMNIVVVIKVSVRPNSSFKGSRYLWTMQKLTIRSALGEITYATYCFETTFEGCSVAGECVAYVVMLLVYIWLAGHDTNPGLRR